MRGEGGPYYPFVQKSHKKMPPYQKKKSQQIKKSVVRSKEKVSTKLKKKRYPIEKKCQTIEKYVPTNMKFASADQKMFQQIECMCVNGAKQNSQQVYVSTNRKSKLDHG